MITIDYHCQGCGEEFSMEVGYFDGQLDEALPNECPKCGTPTHDDAQIDRKHEQAVTG